ncbi:MAG TPA: hypothetical protein VLC72_05895 [Nitrosopumilaceae archaeon]|nr:hypothetical protein [Nitrosopumilaceae archaeon]
MAILKENKEFIESLIHYYISEASSYEQIAEGFVPEIESVIDTAFGIITGNIYSEFMQAYQNQKIEVSAEDVQEFYNIMKERAPLIKKAIMEGTSVVSEEHQILE